MSLLADQRPWQTGRLSVRHLCESGAVVTRVLGRAASDLPSTWSSRRERGETVMGYVSGGECGQRNKDLRQWNSSGRHISLCGHAIRF